MKHPSFFLRRTILLPAAMAAATLLLARCMSGGEEKTAAFEKNSTKGFAGSEACASCHADVYKNHLQTAHFRTSRPATDASILGSFAPGSNAFDYNDRLRVAMEKRGGKHYQVAYQWGEEKTARRMDIVVGSGTMGQSFLNWRGNQLYQLPITFFSAANTWSNSPGFPAKAVFNRVITSRCLECHTTYAQPLTPPGTEPEKFDRNRIIFGVDCERCHGPAAEHVFFQKAHPEEKSGKYIVNPAKLSRQQMLDLCALCHGGALQKKAPSFSFTAGNNLGDFFVVDTTAPDPQNVDVHGNQYGLLRASARFKMSTTLTCNSCHDTHQNERGNLQLFSQRCTTCHQPGSEHFCKLTAVPAARLVQNCIDCHMPLQPSRAIAVFLPGGAAPVSAQIRSHFIGIYPQATQKHLANLSQLQQDAR